MKIIKNGKVLDLSYDHYKLVCTLPGEAARNSAGMVENVNVELRIDNASGQFYVIKYTDVWHRKNVNVTLATKEEAAAIAEDYLEYETYVTHFGDPEGELSETKRKLVEAERTIQSHKENDDYLRNRYNEKSKELEDYKASHEQQLADLRDSVRDLRGENERLTEANSALAGEYNASKAENAELAKKADLLARSNEEIRQQCDGLDAENAKFKEKLRRKSARK